MTASLGDDDDLLPIQGLLEQAVQQHRLPPGFLNDCARIILPVAREIRRSHEARGDNRGGALIWGICGSQGSGKSTLVHFLDIMLDALYGLRCLTLSIDDLYLGQADRSALAEKVHPLLRTRGVPGTHAVETGIRLFQTLKQRGSQRSESPLKLPLFDKARDDVAPDVRRIDDPQTIDIVLFEGWCVGTPPQPAAALDVALNTLEAEEDPDGEWRRYVNAQLEGPYARWYSLIDHLLLIQAPGFDKVHAWRLEQEDKLRTSYVERGETPPAGLMNASQIQRFISHYERLTRWNLQVLPERADLVLELNEDHSMRRLVRTDGAV